MEQIEIVFDINKIQTVAIERVQPNPWNPKGLDTNEYQRIVLSLRKKGLRQPIVVREVEDYFQIIDGEQRWRGWKELGKHEILIYNEGADVSDQEAKELTIAYQQQVPFVEMDLANLLKDMTDQYDNLELPMEEDEIKDLIASLDIDLDKDESHSGGNGKDQEWESMTIRYPLEAKDVIVDEFERIGAILELDPSNSREIRNGLILEKICVLSGDTPIESLE